VIPKSGYRFSGKITRKPSRMEFRRTIILLKSEYARETVRARFTSGCAGTATAVLKSGREARPDGWPGKYEARPMTEGQRAMAGSPDASITRRFLAA
jgi:hypothetical protein